MKKTIQEKIFYYTQPGFFEKTLQELKEIEERVSWLLKNHKHTRNCDRCLIFHYYRLVDGYNGSLYESDIHNLTSAESITRSRRIIQNELGIYLPSIEEIRIKRKIKEDAVREWVSRF